MGLHEFFHHSDIVSCITFHIWKSVDCYFSNKVYRDILRNSYVLTKTLNCLCTLYLKNSNLQIFIHEKLCMKLPATRWKNSCRPMESHWYFWGLDSTDRDHCDRLPVEFQISLLPEQASVGYSCGSPLFVMSITMRAWKKTTVQNINQILVFYCQKKNPVLKHQQNYQSKMTPYFAKLLLPKWTL
jgi:hypothetical protein